MCMSKHSENENPFRNQIGIVRNSIDLYWFACDSFSSFHRSSLFYRIHRIGVDFNLKYIMLLSDGIHHNHSDMVVVMMMVMMMTMWENHHIWHNMHKDQTQSKQMQFYSNFFFSSSFQNWIFVTYSIFFSSFFHIWFK